MSAPQNRLETPIMQDVLVAITALPGAMFYRQNSGLFLTLDGRRPVRASVKGASDIIGAYRGRAVAIETKRAKGGTLRKSQEDFQAAWERAGGVYLVVRSVDETLAGLAAIA